MRTLLDQEVRRPRRDDVRYGNDHASLQLADAAYRTILSCAKRYLMLLERLCWMSADPNEWMQQKSV